MSDPITECTILVVSATSRGDVKIQVAATAFLDTEKIAKAVFEIVQPAHNEAYRVWKERMEKSH